MGVKRLLPESMHVIRCAGYHPYDPAECSWDQLENGIFHFRGELQGMSVLESTIELIVEIHGCSRHEAIRLIEDEIKQDLEPFFQSHDLNDLIDCEEYEGDTSRFNMTKEEVQAEIDNLCQQYRLGVEVLVKVAEQPKERTAAATRFIGMPQANRPHFIVIEFAPHTLELGRALIRSTIRHEFAHCLADINIWSERDCDSRDHHSPEWFTACKELGIKPDSRSSAHETGYYHYWCPQCGDNVYELRIDAEFDEYHHDCHCGNCNRPFERETVHRILCFTLNETYLVEDDGRETLLPIPVSEFIYGYTPDPDEHFYGIAP